MKLSTPFLFILAAVGLVEAAGHDGLSRLNARHHQVARSNDALARRAASGRCKVRPTTSLTSSTHTSTSTHEAETSTKKSEPTKLTTSNNDSKGDSNKGDSNKGDSNKGDDTKTFNKGLVRVNDWSCGDAGASKSISGHSGPNGNIDWLNCGVDSGGWRPPHITVDDVVTVDLDDALKDPNSPFHACKDFIGLFKQHAGEHGIPAIIIASIAMQESSCNPETVGGAGEQGLMQITKDKCNGAPGGNCRDPNFNIQRGTEYFANTLKGYGGSLLRTIGGYNGWPLGMTIDSAQSARWKYNCCRCQNNLDYLQQMLNGWYLNYNPYQHHMGKYFNLDACPSD